mgnify:CR=1 FL=1
MGLLNVDGYYNSLLALFDKGVEEGFIEDSARHIVIIANTADELIKKMEVHKKNEYTFLSSSSSILLLLFSKAIYIMFKRSLFKYYMVGQLLNYWGNDKTKLPSK